MISPSSVCLNSSGIVRILLSCELVRLEFAVLVIFGFRLGSKLPCLFSFLFYFLVRFCFSRTPCRFFSSFLSRRRRAVSYLLLFFSFSRTLKFLIINVETNRKGSTGWKSCPIIVQYMSGCIAILRRPCCPPPDYDWLVDTFAWILRWISRMIL